MTLLCKTTRGIQSEQLLLRKQQALLSERGLPVGGRAGRDSGQQTAAPRTSHEHITVRGAGSPRSE